MKAHKPSSVRHPNTDWRSSTKSKMRRFRLAIEVPRYDHLVEGVLDGLENDTLFVFKPDDEYALGQELDKDGAELLNKRATLPVSICEWLCVACQVIELGSVEEPNVLAHYLCNIPDALFPTESCPLGPAAFTGKIVLTGHCLPRNGTDAENDAFRFIVAHELVHVFDQMRFVVPAWINWEQFWKKVLGEGTRCDDARRRLDDKRLFLDDYASDKELAMVADFWPSKANKWFRAFLERFHASSNGKGKA